MSGSRTSRRPAPEKRRRWERVQITGIAAGGEGVGRLADGRAIFVHRTAPGEVAEVEVLAERPRWARGRLLRVVESAPERRGAPCPHYAECGGCTVEHLRYEAQLGAKRQIVAEALRRVGGVVVDLPEVVPSPLEFRYRNRVSFSLRRRGAGGVEAGFHALHDPGRIVPVDGACLLPEEPIGRVWDRLRGAWGSDANRLPSGEHLRLTLRSSARGAVSLLVEGGFSAGRPEELVERVEGLAAIWHRPGDRAAVYLAGVSGLPEDWGGETFDLGGAAFLQVNRRAAVLLEDHVTAVAGDVTGLRIVDAYCGIGLQARRLARAGASVIGIELDADAVRIATQADAPNARFMRGPVEALLPEVLPADLLVLNPPRAGAAPAAISAILAAPPDRIVYVSCDPATLARDLKRLGAEFGVESARCFDLFPQTALVETVVELRRRPGASGC